jgi:HAUS augmin-like complex subunit 1
VPFHRPSLCIIWLHTVVRLEDLVDILDSSSSLYQAMLNRVGYTPEINHGVLMEMAEHKKDLERKTKPIADTLRSYQDLPPVCLLPSVSFFFLCCKSLLILEHFGNCNQDKALAALAIEDKKRQYAAAEKYLEDVLQSALTTPGL